MLTDDIKEHLQITWDDEDSRIEDIIARGKANLEGLAGVELDFETGQARTLLFEYCRYDYNNAADLFEENFQKQILRLQLNEAANDLQDEEDDNDD